jgi:hypothetical protein
MLRDNADDDELIIYASGPHTFIHAAVVCADRLRPIDQNDLLCFVGVVTRSGLPRVTSPEAVGKTSG